MGIDVSGGADGAVTQEVGHINQGIFLCQQQACESVPQVMELASVCTYGLRNADSFHQRRIQSSAEGCKDLL